MSQEAFLQWTCWDFLGCSVQHQKLDSMILVGHFQHRTFRDKISAQQVICAHEVMKTPEGLSETR